MAYVYVVNGIKSENIIEAMADYSALSRDSKMLVIERALTYLGLKDFDMGIEVKGGAVKRIAHDIFLSGCGSYWIEMALHDMRDKRNNILTTSYNQLLDIVWKDE